MSLPDSQSAEDLDLASPEAIGRAWAAASVEPLWENRVAHRGAAGERAHIWRWRVMERLITAAIEVRSMAAVERRVLSLINPWLRIPGETTTTGHINAALQILLPGETARSHRHTADALRFVLAGSGAVTIVNGKSCLMTEGDLVLNPGWTWHEHVHRGKVPIVWLDVLDSTLHRSFGTARFEAGPPNAQPPAIPDAAFATPHFVPVLAEGAARHSPVFRFPWTDASAALDAAPPGPSGARSVRYVNPMTGGPVLSLLDCTVMEIGPGTDTIPFRTTASAVCAVVSGSGRSRIGEDVLDWEARDVFTLPPGNWISHRATEGPARLFLVTDREMYRRLDLLQEEYGPAQR